MGSRPLFGGALCARIPAEFVDVSGVRQIPDNQEVLAHADGDRSVIVELLESEKDVDANSGDAGEFHWGVLARDAGAVRADIAGAAAIPLDSLRKDLREGDPNARASVAYGVHRVAKFRDSDDKANVVGVALVCVRLPRVATDVLIVVNEPIAFHPESSSVKLGSTVDGDRMQDGGAALALAKNIVASFEVVDWTVFG